MERFNPPMITQRGDVTTERRGAADGSIDVIHTRTDTGDLLVKTTIYGAVGGEIITQRTYPDNSWEMASVKGRADGSIERIITTSEPTAVTLHPPTDLTDSSMTVSWTPNTDAHFAQYELYVAPFSGVSVNDTPVSTLTDASQTSWTVVGLSSPHKENTSE